MFFVMVLQNLCKYETPVFFRFSFKFQKLNWHETHETETTGNMALTHCLSSKPLFARVPLNRKIETSGKFHQHSTYSFYACRSQKHKKDRQVVNLFYAFGIYERKSVKEHWWNWHLVYPFVNGWKTFYRFFIKTLNINLEVMKI